MFARLAIIPPERLDALMGNAFLWRLSSYCMKGDMESVAVPGEAPQENPAEGKVRLGLRREARRR